MVTLQWASVEHGKNCRAVEGRVGFTHRDARRNHRAGAPKRANHALLSSPFSLFPMNNYSCPIRVHSWFYYLPFRVFRVFRGFLPPTSGNARRICRAGALKRASHALLSTFFSLLSTYRTLTHSLSLASLSIITLRILTMSTVSFGGMGTIRSLKNLRMTSTWFSKKSVTCGTAL